MAKAKITEDEWRTELGRLGLLGDGDPGKTIVEIAAENGVPHKTMQRAITKGLAEGHYVRGFAVRLDGLGRRQRVPVYRLAGKAKA